MGYVCPVCTDPQADATHLANHLAFTALVRGGDHEEWLDDHVPEWDSMDEASLGARLAEEADDTEYPQVFEDTTEQGHDHADHAAGHDHGHGMQGVSDAMLSEAESALAAEDVGTPEDVMAKARELTRERREQRGESDANTSDSRAETGGSREQRGESDANTSDSRAETDGSREQRGESDAEPRESDSESE